MYRGGRGRRRWRLSRRPGILLLHRVGIVVMVCGGRGSRCRSYRSGLMMVVVVVDQVKIQGVR